MLCDVDNPSTYSRFRSLKRLYLICFEHKNDVENIKLYNFLKYLENEYPDVPVLRFQYSTFQNI